MFQIRTDFLVKNNPWEPNDENEEQKQMDNLRETAKRLFTSIYFKYEVFDGFFKNAIKSKEQIQKEYEDKQRKTTKGNIPRQLCEVKDELGNTLWMRYYCLELKELNKIIEFKADHRTLDQVMNASNLTRYAIGTMNRIYYPQRENYPGRMYYNERKDWKTVMRRADDNYENTSGTNYEFGDNNQTSYEPMSLTTEQALALIGGDDDGKAEQKVGIDTT